MDFIETKFSPPLLPTNLLVKQKLIDQIESFQYVRLVLVSAPAGYGKTTFIANWLDSGRKTTAWLSLDSIDNRFPLFLEYLIAACRRVLSGFGELIQNRMNYDLNLSLNSICANLVNELSRAGTDITLVFDDFHVITDTSIIDLIQRLLEHLPPNVHLIVISRETPPFHLSRFRSMKQVMDIGPEQLHFTEKETAIYLNDIYGFSLKKEELATLCGKTEGWISGLQMAAISLQTSQNAKGFLNGINKASTSISDYLLEEVFDKQDASVRDFLLSSAIVNRFCDSICQALTQEETVNKAQERILMIQKLNLFVIPLDGSGHWFRYHHMFRDFLLQRLQRRFPERMKQLHSTASHWYEQNGFLSESIHHAFQADLPDRLHGLIKNNAFAVLEAGDLHTLNNWFDRLPSEIVKQTPWLSVVYSYVMLFIGERKGLDFWLDHTEKMIPSITNVDQARTLKGHCHSIRAYLTALEGDVIGAMGILENALKLLPENDFYSVGFCQWVLAVVYRYSGRLEEAVSTVRKAINTLKEGKCLHLLLLAYGELIDIRIIQGQLRHAHALCEEALSYLSEAGKENVEENMYVGYLFIRLGYIWYEWNNREKAAYYTQLGADLITKWGKLGLYTLAAMALARNQYHLKDFTGMWRTLQKAFSRAEAFPGILSRFIEAEEAWAHLNTGNQAAAITWKENFEKAPARDELLPNHVNHQWLV
ncbi:hypothetical protein KKA14_13255, partial [bacterium]|nr:hypothetical protein [bacterium]